MKLLKYSYLALVAVLAAACSDAGPDPDSVAPGVYFPKYNQTRYRVNPVDADTYTFTADVCRTFNTVGTTVGLTSTVEMQDLNAETETWVSGGSDLFEIPTQVVFDNNYSKASFSITAKTSEMEFGQPYRVRLTLAADTKVSDYGTNVYEFTFARVLNAWQYIGDAMYTDGWVLAAFQSGGSPIPVNQFPYKVRMEQNTGVDGEYRLVNPYNNENLPFALPNEDPGDEDHYIVINVENQEVPIIEPQYPGFDFGGSDGYITIMNIEGYFASQGASYDDIVASVSPGDASTFVDNVLTVQIPFFYLSGDSGGPYNWNNPQPAVIAFPNAEGRSAAAAKTYAQRKYEDAVEFFGKKMSMKLN